MLGFCWEVGSHTKFGDLEDEAGTGPTVRGLWHLEKVEASVCKMRNASGKCCTSAHRVAATVLPGFSFRAEAQLMQRIDQLFRLTLRQTFAALEEKLLRSQTRTGFCLSVLVLVERQEAVLVVHAHVGDVAALLIGRARGHVGPLYHVHTATEDRAHAVSQGAAVEPPGDSGKGYTVPDGGALVVNGRALTCGRTLGDCGFKPYALATPHIDSTSLAKKSLAAVLQLTDGVHTVLQPSTVQHTVTKLHRERKSARDVTAELMEDAKYRGSTDDRGVVTFLLPTPRDSEAPPSPRPSSSGTAAPCFALWDHGLP
jgi:hypothetical protein